MKKVRPLVVVLILFLLVPNASYAQAAQTGRQSYSFQYLTSNLSRTQPTSTAIASAFNAMGLPKYFSMSITTPSTASLSVALQGSLDAANWSTLMVTNSSIGVISSILPKPMLFFRMLGSNIPISTTVTATAVGTW